MSRYNHQEINEANGRENKLKVVDSMYTFITKNLGFLNTHDKFKKVVIEKLTELKEKEHWKDADKYLGIINC